jgi:hypothetical protein
LRNVALIIGVLSAAIFTSRSAQAHGDIKSLGSFYTGLMHPFLLPAHALALESTGLLIGQLPREKVWKQLVVFVVAYAGALVSTLWGAGGASINALMILATVAGMLVTIGSPRMHSLVPPIAAISGALLGLDSAADGTSLLSKLLLTLGTFVSGACAVIIISALTSEPLYKWQRIGVRVVGSWTAASSILVLALALSHQRASFRLW